MKLKTLLLLGLALLAAYMARHAVKRNAEVLQLLWLLVGMTALTGTANTSKTRSVEQRLNGLIPVVFPNTGGTITGNVTVTGTHAVGSNFSAGGSVTAGTIGRFGGDVIVGGEISSPTGTLTTNGNHSVTGRLAVNASGSAALEVGGNGHITSGLQVDGVLQTSTGSGMPAAAPSTCGSPAGLVTGSALTWANSATSTINSLRSALISAGVIS